MPKPEGGRRMRITRATVAVLAAFLVLSLAAASAGPITSIATRNTSKSYERVSEGLAEDALSFTDRTHEYNAVPSFLLRLDYVRTANDDKGDPDLELDVTLSDRSYLYVFLDNRYLSAHGGQPLAWMLTQGFADTGFDIGIDESGDGDIDNWSSVFVNTVPAGTATLYGQHEGGSRNMYGVAANIPEPASIAMVGLAIAGMAIRRRRR